MRSDLGLGLLPSFRLVVLTGAGISQESGIPTFRDAGGLWERFDMRQVATPEGFQKDPSLVWRFHSEMRRYAQKCAPNAGHIALADLERDLGDEDRFTLITQNVDDLHRRAGSRRLLEVHGNVFRTRCTDSTCPKSTAFRDEALYEEAPRCPLCGSLMRPDVVWFGEYLDPIIETKARRAVMNCDIFMAVGTSGAVWPAAGYVEIARAAGARTVIVNLDPPENLRAFDEFHQGKASQILPLLLKR